MLWCLLQFSCKNNVWIILVHILLMLFVFIYAYWCPTRFPYHMRLVSYNGNMELLTLPEHLRSSLVFSGVQVARFLGFFVDRCLSFFFCPLCCLSVFDLRLLITPLVSSNFSCEWMATNNVTSCTKGIVSLRVLYNFVNFISTQWKEGNHYSSQPLS